MSKNPWAALVVRIPMGDKERGWVDKSEEGQREGEREGKREEGSE